MSRLIQLFESWLGISKKDIATGTGNIATTVNPGVACTLKEIRLHLSGVGAANNLTVTLDNGTDAKYDTVLLTQDMTSVTDLVWQPDRPIELKSTDKINIAWTNGSGRTYGLEVLYTPI